MCGVWADVLVPGRVRAARARRRGGALRVAAAAPARAALHLAQELRAPVLLPPRGRRLRGRLHPRRAAQPRAAHRHQHTLGPARALPLLHRLLTVTHVELHAPYLVIYD